MKNVQYKWNKIKKNKQYKFFQTKKNKEYFYNKLNRKQFKQICLDKLEDIKITKTISINNFLNLLQPSTLLFIILKMTGIIQFSWWYVICPWLVMFGMIFVVAKIIILEEIK